MGLVRIMASDCALQLGVLTWIGFSTCLCLGLILALGKAVGLGRLLLVSTVSSVGIGLIRARVVDSFLSVCCVPGYGALRRRPDSVRSLGVMGCILVSVSDVHYSLVWLLISRPKLVQVLCDLIVEWVQLLVGVEFLRKFVISVLWEWMFVCCVAGLWKPASVVKWLLWAMLS